MLEVNHLTKDYGKTRAVDDISFVIPDHSVSLLVGPNGAGKSTVLKSIMGLLRYQGEITVDGHMNKSTDAKALLGYVPEVPHLYPLLTVEEHLEFIARVYKLENWQQRADEWLTRFELDDKRNKLGGALSKGMQQKVSICCALLPKPRLILFDEPLVGLDPHAIKEVKLVFRELVEEGQSLLVSTHILDTVDELWDQVLVLQEGKLLAVSDRPTLEQHGDNLESFFFRLTERREISSEDEASFASESEHNPSNVDAHDKSNGV